MYKKILSAAFGVAMALGIGSGAFAGGLSVEEYLALVRSDNPTLQASYRNVEAFYHTVRGSVAHQRPGVALNGDTSWHSDNAAQEQGRYNISLGVTHRFDLSGVYAAQEWQMKLQHNVLAANHGVLVNRVLSGAERLYWSSFIARENVGLQKSILAQRKEDLRITEEKFRQHIIPKLDVIRAEAKVQEASSLVVQAESGYRDTLTQLATLAGGKTVVPRDDPLLVPELSVQVGVDEAIGKRNDIRALELSLEREKVLKTLAAKGMAPVVKGSAGYSFLNNSKTRIPNENEFILELSLSIPLYDGGKTKEDVAEKEKTIEAAEESLRAGRNQVREDIFTALTQWEASVAVEANKRAQVDRSNEELAITQLMYKEGLGAQIDLLNAQVDNQRVRTEHLNAIKEMHLALVSLKQAMSAYEPAQ